MVSGKYSALAGAISREQAIASLSNNLANINTTGFKKSNLSFEAILSGAVQEETANGINYDRIGKSYTDFSPGPMRSTGNPLDLAIEGGGFFKVQGPDGVLYTRRGDLAINQEGLLTTSNGLPLLADGNVPITLPDTDISKIVVRDDGTIHTIGPRDSKSEVGQLAIVEIADKQKLSPVSDTTFALEVGALEMPSEVFRVVQGKLEQSNVNMTEGMTQMIDHYRTYETYQKVIKSYGTISEQQEELGTLG